jgi:hypothetical protein
LGFERTTFRIFFRGSVGKGCEGMIRITIERITERRYRVPERFTLTEEPTGLHRNEAYGREEVIYKKTYETRDVEKLTTDTKELLKQELEDEETFDFVKVVKAINGIS